MYTDADKKLKDLAGQNQYQTEGTPEIAKDFSMEELGGLMFGDDGVIDNGGMLVSDDFIIPEEEFISRQNALDESPFIKIEKTRGLPGRTRFTKITAWMSYLNWSTS